ncbi:pectate lyase, partial [Acinetobacter baumannii]
QPAKARAYELPSLSGAESVGIVQFLMRLQNPTPDIKNAINSAIAWFEKVKIVGYKYADVPDAKLPKGFDRVLLKDSNSMVWA